MGKRQSREELIKERRRELTQTLDEIERSVHTERLSHTDAFRRYVEIMTFYGYDHFTGISDTVSKVSFDPVYTYNLVIDSNILIANT